MIYPPPLAIIRSVSKSLETQLLPGLEAKLAAATPHSVSVDKLNLSTAITMGHLLRHVALRLEREDAQLQEELTLLHDLLGDLRAFCASRGGDIASELSMKSEQFVSGSCSSEKSQPLRERVAGGRELVYEALTWLQKNRAAFAGEPSYRGLRDRIRAYIAFELQCESQLVDAAMSGRGYRR